MNRKQGHEGEDLAGKNKDGNSNLPLTGDKTTFTINSRRNYPLNSSNKKEKYLFLLLIELDLLD